MPMLWCKRPTRGTWLNKSDHPHTIDWGTLRVDIAVFVGEDEDQACFLKDMIPIWRFHRSAFFKQMVNVHTQDKPIEVFSGWMFSLDIRTPFTIDLLKLADEVKAAMPNINPTEGNKFQVAPLSRRSFGNYGQSRPAQARDGTFHYE